MIRSLEKLQGAFDLYVAGQDVLVYVHVLCGFGTLLGCRW